MTEVEGQERVSVIDTVQFLTIHELLNVLLDNRGLVDSSSLGSGGIDTDAISESENVLITLVLKGVWVDIDDTFAVGDAGGHKLVMRLAGRINHSGEEVLLNDLAGINIAESGNLLSILVGGNLGHFPTEENFNASLLALLEGDLVGVGELEDLLVRGPVLNLGVLGSTTL